MDEGCAAAEDIAVYQGHDDCLHNDGQPLLGGETISFEYANAFPSELSVRQPVRLAVACRKRS